MANTITYYLTTTGQAAAIRAGVDAKAEQCVEISREHVLKLLDVGVTPTSTGEVHVSCVRSDLIYSDVVLDADGALALCVSMLDKAHTHEQDVLAGHVTEVEKWIEDHKEPGSTVVRPAGCRPELDDLPYVIRYLPDESEVKTRARAIISRDEAALCAAKAEYDTAQRARADAERAKLMHSREEWDIYACRVGGTIGRAVAKKYNSDRAIIDRVIGQYSRQPSHLSCEDYERRKNPGANALALEDLIESETAKLDKPDSMAIEMIGICRVTDGRCDEKYTAVLIRIVTPFVEDSVYVFRLE